MATRIQSPETNIPLTKDIIVGVLQSAMTDYVMKAQFIDDDGVIQLNETHFVLSAEVGAAVLQFIQTYYPE